jgi:hypothetical protein
MIMVYQDMFMLPETELIMPIVKLGILFIRMLTYVLFQIVTFVKQLKFHVQIALQDIIKTKIQINVNFFVLHAMIQIVINVMVKNMVKQLVNAFYVRPVML